MQDETKKKRVQGEAPRVTSCDAGGEHVLWRPVQKYCDRCRPPEKAADLKRHRARRARAKAAAMSRSAASSGTVVSAAVESVPTSWRLRDVLDAAVELIEQERGKAEELVAADLARRQRDGFPAGPAYRRLDPYNRLHDRLTDARNLAAQIGV